MKKRKIKAKVSNLSPKQIEQVTGKKLVPKNIKINSAACRKFLRDSYINGKKSRQYQFECECEHEYDDDNDDDDDIFQ